jgi:hypothetical protein
MSSDTSKANESTSTTTTATDSQKPVQNTPNSTPVQGQPQQQQGQQQTQQGQAQTTTPQSNTNTSQHQQQQSTTVDPHESVEEKETRLKLEKLKAERLEKQNKASSTVDDKVILPNPEQLSKMDQKALLEVNITMQDTLMKQKQELLRLQNESLALKQQAEVGKQVMDERNKQIYDTIKATRQRTIDEFKREYPHATKEQLEQYENSLGSILPKEPEKIQDSANLSKLVDGHQAVVGMLDMHAKTKTENDQLRARLSLLERQSTPSVDSIKDNISKFNPSTNTQSQPSTFGSQGTWFSQERLKSPFSNVAAKFEESTEQQAKKQKTETTPQQPQSQSTNYFQEKYGVTAPPIKFDW